MSNELGILPCDDCGHPAEARKHLCIEVRSHLPDKDGVMQQARIMSRQWFVFCSDRCRTKWWDTPGDSGISKLHGAKRSDQNFRLLAIHLDGTNGPELREEQILGRHTDLDSFWKHEI